MTCNKNHYEVLCGLAAAGQLSDSELLELEAHLASCISCADHMAKMFEMSQTVFRTTVSRRGTGQTPSGMEQRFVERALKAGIPLTQKTSSSGALSALQLALVACLAIFSINAGWSIFCARRANEIIGATPIQGTSDRHPDENHTRAEVRLPAFAQPAAGRPELERISVRSGNKKLPVGTVRAINDSQNTTAKARTPIVSSKPYELPAFTTEIQRMPFSYPDSGLHLSSEGPLRKVSILSPESPSGAGYLEARAFHYRPELASLSFLDYPQNPGATARVRDLSASTPTFHLDLSRIR